MIKNIIFALLVVTAINTKLIGSNAIKCLDVAVTMSGLFYSMEIWKDIPGYPGYQVSDLGSIKSTKKCRGTNVRLLKIQMGTDGYLRVSLLKNGKQYNGKIHKLVAMAFHGHVPKRFEEVVDHRDNNKLNNRADNLRLTTNRDNCTKDRKGCVSNYVGVTYDKKANKWQSNIRFKGHKTYLGLFKEEINAHNAYQKALSEINLGLDLTVLYPKKAKR